MEKAIEVVVRAPLGGGKTTLAAEVAFLMHELGFNVIWDVPDMKSAEDVLRRSHHREDLAALRRKHTIRVTTEQLPRNQSSEKGSERLAALFLNAFRESFGERLVDFEAQPFPIRQKWIKAAEDFIGSISAEDEVPEPTVPEPADFSMGCTLPPSLSCNLCNPPSKEESDRLRAFAQRELDPKLHKAKPFVMGED